MRPYATNFKMHNREIGMYGGLFPALLKLRDEAGLSAEDIPLDVPESYYVHLDEAETGTAMVIEELTMRGFTMLDKFIGPDVEHVKVALTTLANYHALTNAFLRKYATPDGETVTYPPSVEFLRQPSPLELYTVDMVKPTFDGAIELMRLMDSEEVTFALLLLKIHF